MGKELFETKLPMVLEALKQSIDNEAGNNYDFNFNSYDDFIDKMFDDKAFECFKNYAEAIERVEFLFQEDMLYTDKRCSNYFSTLADALEDYGKGGYRLCETDDEDEIDFDETPFTNRDEMFEFIDYLRNFKEHET